MRRFKMVEAVEVRPDLLEATEKKGSMNRLEEQ